jgi:hypothetical protein
LDEVAGQGVLEVDILDKEVVEGEVVWEDEQGVDEVVENEDGLEDDEEGQEGKSWKEADCRVVLNVSWTIYHTHLPSTLRVLPMIQTSRSLARWC